MATADGSRWSPAADRLFWFDEHETGHDCADRNRARGRHGIGQSNAQCYTVTKPNTVTKSDCEPVTDFNSIPYSKPKS